MPTILTVDDSRAVRVIVSKQVKELGFDVLEAEDGEQGLVRLGEAEIDLVLLDVTMPVLDGPGMLAKMRAAGRKTPVIMLTSESKRSVVAEAMKQGICDYILKPFKPEELRSKILSVLQSDNEGIVQQSAIVSAAPAAASAPAAAPSAARQFVDVLVIDDMENVQKRLRTLLPEHLTLNGATGAQAAVTLCRERIYRAILIDTEIPDVNSATLASQIRILQPHANILALALKSTNDLQKEVQKQGFDDVIYKPFNPESIEEFLLQYFDNQDVLFAEDNVIRLKAFNGKPERIERYVTRLGSLLPPALTKAASACFEQVIVDVSSVQLVIEKTPKAVVQMATMAKDTGLGMALVGTPEIKKLLSGFDETKSIPFFATVVEARAAQE